MKDEAEDLSRPNTLAEKDKLRGVSCYATWINSLFAGCICAFLRLERPVEKMCSKDSIRGRMVNRTRFERV